MVSPYNASEPDLFNLTLAASIIDDRRSDLLSDDSSRELLLKSGYPGSMIQRAFEALQTTHQNPSPSISESTAVPLLSATKVSEAAQPVIPPRVEMLRMESLIPQEKALRVASDSQDSTGAPLVFKDVEAFGHPPVTACSESQILREDASLDLSFVDMSVFTPKQLADVRSILDFYTDSGMEREAIKEYLMHDTGLSSMMVDVAWKAYDAGLFNPKVN